MELDVRVSPFDRHDWHGRFISLDGVDASDFTKDDVAEVVAAGESGEMWDGTVAAVLRLNDGRYVAFETFYRPTGDGFSADAYGGDADLTFARDQDTVVRFGLTQEGRRLCGLSLPDEIAPTVGSEGPGGATRSAESARATIPEGDQ